MIETNLSFHEYIEIIKTGNKLEIEEVIDDLFTIDFNYKKWQYLRYLTKQDEIQKNYFHF